FLKRLRRARIKTIFAFLEAIARAVKAIASFRYVKHDGDSVRLAQGFQVIERRAVTLFRHSIVMTKRRQRDDATHQDQPRSKPEGKLFSAFSQSIDDQIGDAIESLRHTQHCQRQSQEEISWREARPTDDQVPRGQNRWQCER